MKTMLTKYALSFRLLPDNLGVVSEGKYPKKIGKAYQGQWDILMLAYQA